MAKKLWYTEPAAEYMCGLPIGTGRLAAMVIGSMPERVALNHEWLWRGVNRNREPEKNAHLLGEADERPVIMAGDYNSPSHLDWTARAAHLRGDLAVEWPVSKRMAEAGMGSMPTGRCMWTKRRIMGGPTRRFSPRLRIE